VRAIRGVLFAILAITRPIAAQPVDSTAQLQQQVDRLPSGGVLDCGSQRYSVTSLLLKSNMTLQNCWLDTLPGQTDFAAPVTIDGRSDPKDNIAIRNVHIDGNRNGQANIGYAHQEDGGRHGFRLLGRVSHVLIENSSAVRCASDGIALVSYGVATSDAPGALPFQHIEIRNSDFSYNRRQGASADGVYDLSFENVTFSRNGTSLSGDAEGDQCASSGGACYGTGFWYEDYRSAVAGEGLDTLLFSKCVFRENFSRSMFFITNEQPSAPGFQPRGNIHILNSYLDSGLQPLTEDYAVQFQVADALAGQNAIYRNIQVGNSFLQGSVGFRQVANAILTSDQIDTSLPLAGYAAYSTNISFRDVQASGKLLSVAFDPAGGTAPVVSYADGANIQYFAPAPPPAGTFSKGDIVWNTQPAIGQSGWVCLAAGTPCSQWQVF